MRIRVRYSINGKIRFISHLDLMRAFFRACMRKNIPVQVSQGFSPHLKISFGPPLSVGMTSSDEYLDMYTDERVDKTSLQEGLPEGIRIEDVLEVQKDMQSLCVTLNRVVYIVKVPNNTDFAMDVPTGCRPIDVLSGLWPDLSLDELKLWPVHREKLYNEGDTN